jgi:hypothetical protein
MGSYHDVSKKYLPLYLVRISNFALIIATAKIFSAKRCEGAERQALANLTAT